MKTDRAILAARTWAIPAICGLLVLHHDFKGGRFAKVTRLVWAQSSVDVHLVYGAASVTGSNIDSLNTIFTVHQNGAVGLRPAAGESEKGRRNILRFLAGEASREALRWSVDLANWTEGTLDDDIKSVIFSLVSAAVAHPFMDIDVIVEKGMSHAGAVRKIRLLSESLSTEMTPAGRYGVNVYQAGHGSHDGVRIRYMEPDMRSGRTEEKGACPRFLENARDGVLHVMLLPVATLAYLCEKKQMADMRVAGALVEYLPNLPVDARVDAGMSALSN
ncbi:MAG: hypothetical protein NVSMB6_09810 [Burkholderiaceae bacterium]